MFFINVKLNINNFEKVAFVSITCVIQHDAFVSDTGRFDIPGFDLLQKIIEAPRLPARTQDPGKPQPPQPLTSKKATLQER